MSTEHAAVVSTPLGPTALTFTHLNGREEISRCFAYTVGFAARDPDIDPLKMLGAPVSVEAESGDHKRWFAGFVSDFRLVRIEDRMAYYEAVIRPWLWFLANRTDCRIFQQKNVVDIIEEVFSFYPAAKFEKRLQGSYPPREYCVQYDESDLDFVQRLMEHEGIFYFFEYADGEHTLVLADAMNKLKPAPGYETVPYRVEGNTSRRDVEYVTAWIPSSSVKPGAYAHTDYDFKKPAADLMAVSAQPFEHKQASAENYRQPGSHRDLGRGDAIAEIRREELQAAHRRISATTTARGLFSGCTFKLSEFPRKDQNQEYLVVSAEYRIFDPAFATGVETSGDTYVAVIGLAPTAIPFRPPHVTRRPVMRGPQTAVVVGPAGEEIFTDEYARVKVQFHWDRLGKKDQDSSCFVRVSQVWAGNNWGFIQIPRIGQEVIVDFIEGDPDLPIITGRVYNAAQMPPYALPANATQSGWKSRSSKGGGPANFNEIRFEDKKGSEQVYFHAEKNNDNIIENNRTKFVGNDQSDRIDHDAKHSVGHDLTEDVGHDKSTHVMNDRKVTIDGHDAETVHKTRTLTVDLDETITVNKNSTETIALNHTQTVGVMQTVTVGAARVDTVGAAETRTVGAVQTNSIGANRSVSVGINQSHSIGAKDSWSIGAAQDITVGAGQTVKIGGGQTTQIGKERGAKIATDDSIDVGGGYSLKVGKGGAVDVANDQSFKVGKNFVVNAGDSITLKTGSASIIMKKDGTITIKGKDILIQGSGKINVKASSDVIIKGSKISEN